LRQEFPNLENLKNYIYTENKPRKEEEAGKYYTMCSTIQNGNYAQHSACKMGWWVDKQ
jgi:hypothetical protein